MQNKFSINKIKSTLALTLVASLFSFAMMVAPGSASVASAASKPAAKAAAVTAITTASSNDTSSSSKPAATAGVNSATVSYKSAGTGYTYRLRYAASPYKTWISYAPTTTALRQTVSPLTAGTSYEFEVSSKKTTTWGAWSEASNAVTPTRPVVANFSIAASATAGGTISPAGSTTVASGGSQTYTITPNSGFQVSSVTVDSTSVGAVRTYTFSNVTANHSILASFTAITWQITASAGAHGSISPNGATNVANGTSQAYSITPATGYHVADVLVDGTSVGAVTSYTFNGVSAAHTIAATFAINTYNINASVDFGSGSISPNGTTSVSYGGSQTYTITPASGFRINDIYVDGSLVPNTGTYSFTNVTASHTILVSFTQSSYDIVSFVDFGSGTISPDGTTAVSAGASQTYTFTPSSGYHVSDVYVDNVSVGAPSSYTFSNVSAGHTVYVQFTANSYDITAGVDYGSGTISPDGTTTLSEGGSQTYTITPDAGYAINEIYVDNVLISNTNSYTFSNVTSSHNILVSFVQAFTVTADSAGPGSVSGSGVSSVGYGKNMTYTFTPNANSFVSDVLVDGVSIGAYYSYTFTNVTSAHTISVTFEANSYDLYADVDYGSGSVSPLHYHTVYNGDDQTYTFTPDEGYYVYNVIVDNVSLGGLDTYTFTNVKSYHEIWVQFEPLRNYNINAFVDYGQGTISDAGDLSVGVTQSQTYTITPATGYHIADVVVDNVSVGAVSTFTFTNVRSDHQIFAQFEADPVVAPTGFTLTYDSNGDQSNTYSTTQKQVDTGSIYIEYSSYNADNNASFWGWNTKADGTGDYYYPEDSYDLNADATLYAIWYFNADVTLGDLEAGSFANAYAVFKAQTLLDPSNQTLTTIYANSTTTFKLMAHQSGPYSLFITGAYSHDASWNYTGPYTMTSTGIGDWYGTGFQPAYMPPDYVVTQTMIMFSYAYGPVTISIGYNPPS